MEVSEEVKKRSTDTLKKLSCSGKGRMTSGMPRDMD
jgi:hypothetical protein